MLHFKSLLLAVFILATVLDQPTPAQGFNFLTEFFNDLKFGSLGNEYLTKKLGPSGQTRCLQGSYSFNGSCYFVSNKKHIDASEKDIVLDYLMKVYKKGVGVGGGLGPSTTLGLAAEIANAPSEAAWKDAANYCRQLNNDSTLFFYNNNQLEFEFVIDLLKRLNFPSLILESEKNAHAAAASSPPPHPRIYLSSVLEQKYFIGVVYNNSRSRLESINETPLNQDFIDRYELHKLTGGKYKECAHISLRDNGELEFGLTNCNNDKFPYVCKYIVDRCYNNTSCGRNGECVNLIHKKSFECRCRIFYDGDKCQAWSNQGIQMLIAVSLVLFAFAFVFVLKLMNKIKNRLIQKRERQKRELIYQNHYYAGVAYETAEAEEASAPQNRYSLQVLHKNVCRVVGYYIEKKLKLFVLCILSLCSATLIVIGITFIRSKMIEIRIRRFFDSSPPVAAAATNSQASSSTLLEDIDKDNSYSYLTTVFSWDLCKIVNDQFLEDYFLVVFSLSLTMLIYAWNSFSVRRSHKYFCKFSTLKCKRNNAKNENDDDEDSGSEQSRTFIDSFDVKSHSSTAKQQQQQQQQQQTSNCLYRLVDLYVRCRARTRFLRRLRRFVACGLHCSCGLEFPVPMNPFSKRNRFLTGLVYAAYTYNILKIFEHLLIGGESTSRALDQAKSALKGLHNRTASATNLTSLLGQLNASAIQSEIYSFGKAQERGILMDLLKQIVNVFIIGLRYYPVLLCVELKRKSKLCYLLCTLYVSSIFVYYLYMNTFCLLSAYTAIKDFQNTAKQQAEAAAAASSAHNNSQFAGFFQNLGLGGDTGILVGRGAAAGRMVRPPNSTTVAAATISSLFSATAAARSVRQHRQVILLDPDESSSVASALSPSEVLSTISMLPYFNQRSRLIVKSSASSSSSNQTDSTTFNDLRGNISSSLITINRSIFWDNFMYEKFVFYIVLCLISFNMITETTLLFVGDLKRRREKRKREKKSCCTCCGCQRKPNESHQGSADIESDLDDQDADYYSIGKVEHELKYTSQLLKQPLPKPISFSKYLFEKYIYRIRKDFRYSKQFINTHIIAFILLYYVTCLIIRKSKLIMSMSSNLLLMLISFIFKMNAVKDNSFMLSSKATMSGLIESLYENLSSYIVIACVFSSGMYAMQLFIGIRRYQKNVLNAYKGKYVDIPAPKRFANAKLVSSSLHYSGYAIGYMLWGYIILFEMSLVILLIIRFLVKFYFIAENLAKIVLPILTIFLFKRILIWYLCKYFLVRSRSQQKVFLKNGKLYFILSHFNFFFDCFLGSFVCSMRMVKSSLAALLFMPRLDYSIFGRYLEKTDLGFISYVTFIHMEVNQTHPVKLAACELMLRTVRASSPSSSHAKSRAVTLRNKWLVAVTLCHNPQLKALRKKHLYLHGLMPNVESFEKFLERKVRTLFLSEDTRKKSRSTPCLLDLAADDANKSSDNHAAKTSTIDFSRPQRRNPPPPPIPRRNIKNIYNGMPTAHIYNHISDSSEMALTDHSTIDLNHQPVNSGNINNVTFGSSSYFSNRSYPNQ